jgi:hypothetical protein
VAGLVVIAVVVQYLKQAAQEPQVKAITEAAAVLSIIQVAGAARAPLE